MLTRKAIQVVTINGKPLLPNISLQGTFDPLAVLANAKKPVASNAPELRRWAA